MGGRYDESCTGEVDYNDFVEKVMESDFKAIHESCKKSLNEMVKSVLLSKQMPQPDECEQDEYDSDSNEEEQEREQLRRREIKKCFDVVDSDNSGFIDKKEFDSILKCLGKDLRKDAVDECFRKIDGDMSGHIEFNEFYNWFRSGQKQRTELWWRRSSILYYLKRSDENSMTRDFKSIGRDIRKEKRWMGNF